MGFFNPISYFIKSFIRLFTKKFFWVILILFCLCLGFILFSPEVKAVDSNYTFYNDYFSSSDIQAASDVSGANVWGNEDYDIILLFNPNNSRKRIIWFNTTSLPDDTYYRVNTDSTDTFQGYLVKPFYFSRSYTENTNDIYVTGYGSRDIYDNREQEYYDRFPPAANPGWR